MNDIIMQIICCPRCRARLDRRTYGASEQLFCTYPQCKYSQEGFLEVSGQPVLIDFDNSILLKDDFLGRSGHSPLPRDGFLTTVRNRLLRFFFGTNRAAQSCCASYIDQIKRRADRPLVLVIGGGTKGSGAEALYDDASINLVGTDIYVSRFTMIIADGHQLPFFTESFDGVWIQAVLEHVLDPPLVVEEIHRILKPDGLVFAETPFMQQVHEKAYDFTRYTLSGHRWLFRHFALIDAGVSLGAGTAFIWSIRYLVRSVTRSNKAALLVSLLFFWVRFLDQVSARRPNADAASGVFFFGRKAAAPIGPHDMVEFYEQQI